MASFAAEDPTALMTPDVLRVGEKLACRCGGCRNTVGNCPMLRCHYADPMRARIKGLLGAGKSDAEVVNEIVQSEGVVALATPPTSGWGLVAWLGPGVALLIGFWFYSWFLRRKRAAAESPVEANPAATAELLERFRDEIHQELADDEPAGTDRHSSVAKQR